VTENKKILVIGSGQDLSVALEFLARDLEVHYFSPSNDQFGDKTAGYGFSRFGLHLTPDFYSLLNSEKDQDQWLIVLTDTNFGDLAAWLRDDGWRVFGPDKEGQKMEKDHEFGKKVLTESGVDVPVFQAFGNLNEVIDHLTKIDPGKEFILKADQGDEKANTWKGTPSELVEKFKEVNPVERGMKIGYSLEEYLPGVSVTSAAFFNGEKFLNPVMRIYASCYGGYITWFENCPVFNQGLAKLSLPLKKAGYRGLINLDGMFVGKGMWDGESPDRDIYAGLDFRAKLDEPFSRVYVKMISNLEEVFDKVASGEDCKIGLICKDAFFINAFREEGATEEDLYLGDIWKIERDNPSHYGITFDKVAMNTDGGVTTLPGSTRPFQMIGFGNSYMESLSSCMEVLRLCSDRIKTGRSTEESIREVRENLISNIRDRVVFLGSWVDE
jgi:hypothetical protein